MGPVAIPFFFLSSWIAMVFWGRFAPGVGLATVGYPTAMLATLALWAIVLPVSWRGGAGRLRRRSSKRAVTSAPIEKSPDTVDLEATFGATSRRVASDDFRGGRARARFGGVELDLRKAVIRTKPARLEVDAFLGGIEIKVPEEWVVEIDVASKFGGVSDERDSSPVDGDRDTDLIITGSTSFGGLSIKD